MVDEERVERLSRQRDTAAQTKAWLLTEIVVSRRERLYRLAHAARWLHGE